MVLWRTFRLYNEDSCGTYAAAIAYYAIFSIVPLALVILSVLGLVLDPDRVTQFVFDQLPLREDPSVQENVDQIVQTARDVSPAGLGFGAIALLWSSSGIFSAVRRGLNAASHRQRRRPYWRGRAIDFALIPSLGLLILISIGLTGAVQVVIERTGDLGPFQRHQNIALVLASYALPAVISFVTFLLLYRYVPSSRPRWPDALTGALCATILFELAKNLYAYFLARAPFERDTAIYAGFGTALAFLLWMFINASILLVGVEFARAVRLEVREKRSRALAAEPAIGGGTASGSSAPVIGQVDRGHRGL
ncbi:MAG: YihY/virulence factor BrkB family protein [Hyphomicrobiales bacterium]